jgi:hypothetical protein
MHVGSWRDTKENGYPGNAYRVARIIWTATVHEVMSVPLHRTSDQNQWYEMLASFSREWPGTCSQGESRDRGVEEVERTHMAPMR